MSVRVKLIAHADGAPKKEYVFDNRTTCIVGRSPDCQIRVIAAKENLTVSRYHCMIDVNPPEVSVRDFGSLNGTYVNGQLIGKRDSASSSPDDPTVDLPAVRLEHGDEVKIWQLKLTVQIENTKPVQRDVAAFKQLLAGGAVEVEQDSKSVCVDGYAIEDELGRGGMGVVYLATSEQQNAKRVIKVIRPEMQASKWHMDSFLREATNTLALKHRHIVEVHDWGWSGDAFYLAMEYCDSGTLESLLEERKRISVESCVKLIRQVLAGLHYAHRVEVPNVKLADGTIGSGVGLIHRDLSPENILLDRSSGKLRAKIADFGLSKVFDLAGLSGFTLTGMYAGKPNCICRQQILEYRDCQPEVDVWAAAACLYYMLTGTFPREFTPGRDVWLTVLNDPTISISERGVDIPAKLARVIDAALDDRKKLEFQSAAQLSEALDLAIR